jgi:hypothetical protein
MKVSLHTAALAVSLSLGAATVMNAAPAAAAGVAKATAATTVSGTIKSVDASAKTLTLTTAKGDETFSLGDKTSIHHGSKAATVADLSSLSGQPAKVHYTDSNGTKMVTSVMVGGAHHTAAEHKAASSSAKPK